MRWPEDLTGWPNAAMSRLIDGPVHRWHVQDKGAGDVLLLIHGAGGATHSWRDLMEPLSKRHRVIALDLAGHGFTQSGPKTRSGLKPMAEDVAALAQAENWSLRTVIGHSAGGAVALQMALDGTAPSVITFNAALSSFKGVAGALFPALARILATTPFAPSLLARVTNSTPQVTSLLNSTGSTLDDGGVALYRRLVSDPDHVAGTLRMMAQWDLEPLRARLSDIAVPTHLITGAHDRTVSPQVSAEAASLIPHATHISFEKLGHLAHEEDPTRAVSEIEAALARLNASH
jgi:magnesium chelatase accessory protein